MQQQLYSVVAEYLSFVLLLSFFIYTNQHSHKKSNIFAHINRCKFEIFTIMFYDILFNTSRFELLTINELLSY